MPTGFTAPVYDGESVSPKELASRFARGLSFTINQRDSDISVPPELLNESDFRSLSKIDEIENKILETKQLSDAQITRMQQKERAEVIADNDRRVEEKRALVNRYTQAIKVFENWAPETEAGHGVKKFALQQLRESLEFDGREPYQKPVPDDAPEEYREHLLSNLNSQLERERENLERERSRRAEFNNMIQDFLDDIETLSDKPLF